LRFWVGRSGNHRRMFVGLIDRVALVTGASGEWWGSGGGVEFVVSRLRLGQVCRGCLGGDGFLGVGLVVVVPVFLGAVAEAEQSGLQRRRFGFLLRGAATVQHGGAVGGR